MNHDHEQELWIEPAREVQRIRAEIGSSAGPFTAGGKPIAEDGPGLRSFYEEMLDKGSPKPDRVPLNIAEQINHRDGSLPRGGDEDDMAFAWVELGGENLSLHLASKSWRVVGIDR